MPNKGQASVEALLVLMILGLLIFGGIELSRGVAVRQALDSGSGAAVRALSLDPCAMEHLPVNLIQQSVNQNVMGAGPTISVQIYDSGQYTSQFSLAFGQPIWNGLYPGSFSSFSDRYSLSAESGDDHSRAALGHCGALPMRHFHSELPMEKG